MNIKQNKRVFYFQEEVKKKGDSSLDPKSRHSFFCIARWYDGRSSYNIRTLNVCCFKTLPTLKFTRTRID